MIILGVDYGRRRIGLALAISGIIETKGFVNQQKNRRQTILKIKEICRQEGVEKIVVGLSQGKMGQEIKEFAKELRRMIKLPIELVDETLTSWQAEKMVGWKNKGRVDSVAAALILERYLDRLNFN